MGGRLACAWFALLPIGCAAFPLQPYEKIVWDTSERTHALQRQQLPAQTVNRAAMLPGRSQGAIKPVLASLWQPSMRPSSWLNYNGLLATRYSQLDTPVGPLFQPGELTVKHLGTDARVQYVAAFHPGRRLPLVVATSGINGTVDGKITLDVLQHLYDTGDFHVVHLESVTSVNHQVRNQQPFLGGMPEGLLLYQTVEELRSRPRFADQIDQVHLLGVSYGGMLCGIAAHCEDKFRRGVVDGAVLALSPPLDLRILFDNLTANAFIHDKIRQGYVDDGVKRYLQFDNFGLSHHELHELDFDSYVTRIALPYAQKTYPAIKAEYPNLPPINDADDLYTISSMRPHLATLGVPYFFVHAYDDPVVSPGDHFDDVLRTCPNPLVDGLLLENGGHLGFDAVSSGTPGFTSRLAEQYFRYWSACSREPVALR